MQMQEMARMQKYGAGDAEPIGVVLQIFGKLSEAAVQEEPDGEPGPSSILFLKRSITTTAKINYAYTC